MRVRGGLGTEADGDQEGDEGVEDGVAEDGGEGVKR